MDFKGKLDKLLESAQKRTRDAVQNKSIRRTVLLSEKTESNDMGTGTVSPCVTEEPPKKDFAGMHLGKMFYNAQLRHSTNKYDRVGR